MNSVEVKISLTPNKNVQVDLPSGSLTFALADDGKTLKAQDIELFIHQTHLTDQLLVRILERGQDFLQTGVDVFNLREPDNLTAFLYGLSPEKILPRGVNKKLTQEEIARLMIVKMSELLPIALSSILDKIRANQEFSFTLKNPLAIRPKT